MRLVRILSFAILILTTYRTTFCQTAGDTVLSISQGESGTEFVITNNGSSAVTAFVVTADFTSHGYLTRFYFDVVVNYKRDFPIVPGDEHRISLPSGFGRRDPVPTLRAVIYENGSTWGDGAWVNELQARRELVLNRLNRLQNLLSSSPQGVSVDNLLGTIANERDIRRANNTHLGAEDRLLEDLLHVVAIKSLSGGMRVRGRIPSSEEAVFHLNRLFVSWRDQILSAKGRPQPSEYRPLGFSATHGPDHFVKRIGYLKLAACASTPVVIRGVPRSMPQGCSVEQNAYVANGPDQCGNTQYVLVAGTQWFGSWWAYGVCTGGYISCNGNSVEQGYWLGEAHGFQSPNSPNTQRVWWVLDSWFKEYFGCDCTEPYPNGVYESVYPVPYQTPMYVIDCP